MKNKAKGRQASQGTRQPRIPIVKESRQSVSSLSGHLSLWPWFRAGADEEGGAGEAGASACIEHVHSEGMLTLHYIPHTLLLTQCYYLFLIFTVWFVFHHFFFFFFCESSFF